MATKRRGISKRIRFEVFKRDGFACQYCGAKAPDVLLQVDHIAPVSKGGGNEILNYVTSCEPCNAGKSDRELGDQSILAKQRAQIEDLGERREQLRMMISWRDGLRSLDEEKLNQLVTRMNLAHPGWVTNDYGRRVFEGLISKTPFDLALIAVDEAAKTIVLGADGRATKESITGITDMVCRIAATRTADRKNPGLKDLYYIRGIARKRFDLVDWQALDLLKQAHAAGVQLEDLRDAALRANRWGQFRSWIEDLIAGATS